MKQMIEIEVPEGKKAVWEDGKVVFKDAEPYWKSLKTFDDCYKYLLDNELYENLPGEYQCTQSNSYSETICKYRIIVAALTNNEKRSLTTGERWFSTIEFCRPNCLKNCHGNKVVGKIKSEGEEYLVIGGGAHNGMLAGLGRFDSNLGTSDSWATVGFRSVSSKEVAEHISTYFGKLLFEVQYGGVNCDWEWI